MTETFCAAATSQRMLPRAVEDAFRPVSWSLTILTCDGSVSATDPEPIPEPSLVSATIVGFEIQIDSVSDAPRSVLSLPLMPDVPSERSAEMTRRQSQMLQHTIVSDNCQPRRGFTHSSPPGSPSA
jgi:hypothetical protein